MFTYSGFSTEASRLQIIGSFECISPCDWFTLRNNLSSISVFVYESLLLPPLYGKLHVAVKSPFMVVFPAVFIFNSKGHLSPN